MIEAIDLRVDVGGRTVLDGIDLGVGEREVVGVVGPNGSGKSTLLRALIGVRPPARGTVRIDGVDVRSASRRWIARRAAFVGQMVDPDPALSVADEVSLGGLATHGAWRAQGRSFRPRIERALATVGLVGAIDVPLAELSGGERQRVQLARAMVHGADYALLDEPTNHLDVRHRLELLELLPHVARSVIVVLHDLELAARACDRILLLSEGRVAAFGRPHEVLRPELLDPVYGVRTRVSADDDGRPRLSFSLAAAACRTGAGDPAHSRVARQTTPQPIPQKEDAA